MENKFLRSFLAVSFLFLTNLLFGVEPSDLDGTWVYTLELLDSPSIHEWDFVWGKGKKITETTLAFEVEISYVFIPGVGAYTIASIESEDSDTIYVKMFYIGDKNKEQPVIMRFHFFDIDSFWIECPEWEEDFLFMVGRKWIWYRLSGPQRK
jgi:hypothetical protein